MSNSNRLSENSAAATARRTLRTRLVPTFGLIVVPALAIATACSTAGDASRSDASAHAGVQVSTAAGEGTAQSFAVLAGQRVTNTGPTLVFGNLGVWPGTAVTGFPPGVVSDGAMHPADAVALQAQSDATTTYNALAGRACDVDLSGQDLVGLTLTPGTYCFSSSAQLSGVLTLDAKGDPDALFVFQIGSTLTTASASTVAMINGANPCNVSWQVGSSATLGTTSTFVGTLVALTSITLTNGALVNGRALARNGSVTMDSNTIHRGSCEGGAADAGSPDGGHADDAGHAQGDTGVPDAAIDAGGTAGTPGSESDAGSPGSSSSGAPGEGSPGGGTAGGSPGDVGSSGSIGSSTGGDSLH